MKKVIYLLVVLMSSCATGTYTVEGDSGQDIQKMIDLAYANGGGRVVVPAGVYDVASIQLKSNVDLHLEKDAQLLGSDESEDYDSFPQDVCTINPENSTKVLVYAYNCENIAITGEGTIDGQGPLFFDTSVDSPWTYSKPPVERPLMVKFVNCNGVRLEGVTFKDSPCWSVMLRLCENIEVNGITITADQKMINNDGIDFDGCRHAKVSGSNFKTCDDCLVLRAIKESPDQDIVCEDIRVENCSLNSACQTVRLGAPSDGIVRDAVFTNITAKGNNGIFADFPVRYLAKNDTGSIQISNITFENYSGEFYGSALQIVSEPGVTTKVVDGFTFRNFDVKCKFPLRFIGNKDHEIGSVHLENFTAVVESDGNACQVAGCNGLDFKNVTLNGQKHPDGPVTSEMGSDAKLTLTPSISWERNR